MNVSAHLVLMAEYNEWMNSRLYEAAAALAPEQLQADKGAFFGSLYGTLNHVLLADIIWLQRFARHPSAHAALDPVRALPTPKTYDVREGDFSALRQRRRELDVVIRSWASALSETDLDHVLKYNNSQGQPYSRRFGSLVLHFFNHQTHHRGQATALLSQAGIDMGSTDLLVLIPEQ